MLRTPFLVTLAAGFAVTLIAFLITDYLVRHPKKRAAKPLMFSAYLAAFYLFFSAWMMFKLAPSKGVVLKFENWRLVEVPYVPDNIETN